MDVMVLAAGRGERMRPLTDRRPKPLLAAGGDTLIGHLLTALACSGHTRIVINLAHLGEQLVEALGDGSRLGLRIEYSLEPPGALDTGGGILNALSLLRSDPFAVINADIWSDYPFERLPGHIGGLAHLVLADNPCHHPEGDFVIEGARVDNPPGPSAAHALTFTGIGVYRRALFEDRPAGRFPLADLLRPAAAAGLVTGEHFRGHWFDIGTPQRLAELDAFLQRRISG
jgi:MurNAc alpha-1-phosphate uridylyltransferase